MTFPTDFWINEKNRLLAVLRPRLAQMAYEGAKQAAFKAGIEFNPVLANAQAVEYARTQTDSLLNRLGTTSESLVGAALGDWLNKPGATIGDLQDALKPAFGRSRASVIAATETTRAYASGEMSAYLSEGYTEWIWVAHRDELVCPICGVLAGKRVRIGQPFGEWRGEDITQPPAHPNCRCGVKAVVTDKQREKAENGKIQPAFVSVQDDLNAGEKARLAPLTGGNPIPFQLGTRSGNFTQDLLDLEKDNGLAKDEAAYVFDQAGNPVIVVQGGPKKVVGLGSSLNNFFRTIVTHNHPAPGAFSDGDIKFIADHKPDELRASDHQYSYRIKIDPNLDFATIEPAIKKHKQTLDNLYASLPTTDENEMRYSHELWELVSKEFQQKGYTFEYERKEW